MKHQKQFSLYEQLKPVLDEYSEEVRDLKEKALDKASDFLVEKLSEASPVSPKHNKKLKERWLRTDKYKSVRYIGNSAVASKNEYGYDIPLTNILEFSKKGNPFIRRTFEENKEKIINIIKETIEDGNSG